MACLQVEGLLQEIILDLANLTLTQASIILSIQFSLEKEENSWRNGSIIFFISLFNYLVLNANLDADRS